MDPRKALFELLARLDVLMSSRYHRLACTCSVTGLELICLRWLAAAQPMALDELAERCGLGTAATIGVVESLESVGLVAITVELGVGADPQASLTLTHSGMELVGEAPVPAYVALLEEVAELGGGEQEFLAEGVRMLVELLESAEAEEQLEPSWSESRGTS